MGDVRLGRQQDRILARAAAMREASPMSAQAVPPWTPSGPVLVELGTERLTLGDQVADPDGQLARQFLMRARLSSARLVSPTRVRPRVAARSSGRVAT
jgi:hypothetical protein